MQFKTKVCKYGVMAFPVDDYYIGGALDHEGVYSQAEIEKLCSLIDDDSVVFEVGANIGAITVPLARKASKVHAFEPQPDIVKCLASNVERNDLSNDVIVNPIGLSDQPGLAVMGLAYRGLDKGKTNYGAGALSMANDGEIFVATIDRYVDTNRIERVDLIKIDVEGMEGKVLAGASQTISRFKPILYVENDRAEKSVALIEQIMGLGYKLYWHFPPLYNPDISGTPMVSVNMLCLPPGRLADISDCVPIVSPHDDWQLALERQTALGLRRNVEQCLKTTYRSLETWAGVVRLGGIGDNLMVTAVLPYLKETYGKVEVITADPQHVIFENNPHVDRLTIKSRDDVPKHDAHHLYWHDRSKEYAFFADLTHTCEATGALFKSQTQFWWSAEARRKLCGKSYLEIVADVVGAPYEGLEPRFYPTEQETEAALALKERIGGRYAAWVISGSRVDKVWPYAPQAIARIIRELDMPVVLFGASHQEFEIAKVIQSRVQDANGDDGGLHLALSPDPTRPSWPIRRLMTQVQAADIAIGPDTGLMWGVASEPTFKVVLLSHASPINITKYWRNTISLTADPIRVPCWPCHQLHDNIESCQRTSGRKGEGGAACISSITTEQVLRMVKHILEMGGEDGIQDSLIAIGRDAAE
jgi:FkbM family methyltransferase